MMFSSVVSTYYLQPSERQLLYFYPDYYLLKAVTDPAETTGNFAGLDRRFCLAPNTLKKGVIAYLSIVYRLSQISLQTFSKKGIDFFEIGQALRSDGITTPSERSSYPISGNSLLHFDRISSLLPSCWLIVFLWLTNTPSTLPLQPTQNKYKQES